MLRLISALFTLFLIIASRGGWAYEGLIIEPVGESETDQKVALAIEHALTQTGCHIKARGVVARASNVGGTLMLRLSPLITDQAHGRYSGYGLQLDSILWTASLRSQLVEPESQSILATFDETSEERQIPSSNGSHDLSGLVTNAQLVDSLARDVGRRLVTKVVGILTREGVCHTAGTTAPSQPNSPPEGDTGALEVKRTESFPSLRPAASSANELSAKATKKSHSAEITEDSSRKEKRGEYRVALVIGNTHYGYIPTLKNPSNDARFIGEQILASGFELVGGAPLMDLTKTKFERAVADFGQLLSQHPGAVGFFYYAGHGIQVNGANYLVPTDANPNRIADLSRQAIAVDTLLQEMEDSRTGLNIIVLDACRNNPFGGRGIRESGAGLAQVRAPKGSIIVYATQPGNIALDGPSGQNSPFAKALAYALSDSELDLFGTFNEVGLLVADATGGEQQPWISSSPISGRFCFKACPK